MNLHFFCPSAVDRFPVSEREKEQNTNSIERTRGQSNSSKQQEHNHNREVIFAFPSLRLHFKSEHLQSVITPDISSGITSGIYCVRQVHGVLIVC